MNMIKIKNILKKFLKIILLIFIIFLLIKYVLYEFIIAKKIAESATNKYLQILNIDKDEIESQKIYYSFKLGSEYNILIKYKNEPSLKYWYRYIIKENKFFIDDIVNENTSIALLKQTKPLHETPIIIELLVSEKYKTLENKAMKYTFFDYIKDLIKKNRTILKIYNGYTI